MLPITRLFTKQCCIVFQNYLIKSINDILWDDIILIFTYEEICDLLAKAVTQKEGKPDKMWAFAFNDVKHIFIARGKHKNEEITKYLLGNKISEIEQKFLE